MKSPLALLALAALWHSVAASQSQGQASIQLAIYAEMLCPASRKFFVELASAMESALGEYLDLSLHMWGNAKRDKAGVECQHGPAECRLNRVANCAARLAASQEQWVPFLACLSRAEGAAAAEAAIASCAASSYISPQVLNSCASGDLGAALEKRAAQGTDFLDPPLSLTPWVIVNDAPLRKDYKNFKSYICKAIEAEGDIPGECSGGWPNSHKATVSPAQKAASPLPPKAASSLTSIAAWQGGRRLMRV